MAAKFRHLESLRGGLEKGEGKFSARQKGGTISYVIQNIKRSHRLSRAIKKVKPQPYGSLL